MHYFLKEAKEIRERDRRVFSENAIPINVTITLQSPSTVPSSCHIQAISITTSRAFEFGLLVAELSL